MRIHSGLTLGTLNLGAISDPIEKRPSEFESLSPFTGVYIGSPLNLNWILHGGLSRIHAINASDKNKSYPFSSYQLTSFSMGISHYLMPYHAYISLHYRLMGRLSHSKKRGPQMGSTSFTEVEQTFDSNRGIGITLGKEWQTRHGWALGFALIFFRDNLKGDRTKITQTNPDSVYDIENVDDVLSTHFGLVFSASYN